MKSRFRLNLTTATIEAALVHCLNAVGCERGDELLDTADYHNALLGIAECLKTGKSKCGFLFFGRFGTGKTTTMLAIRKFFDLLKNISAAWEYQEIDSLESSYIRAEDFRHPIASISVIEQAAKAPVLFFDNLGMETEAPKDSLSSEMIKNLLRLRYDLRMLTFVSTPLDAQNLREIYGSQILSIMRSNYCVIEFDWEPFRK